MYIFNNPLRVHYVQYNIKKHKGQKMRHLENRDFETPADAEPLTDHQLLNAERLVVDYVYSMSKLPEEVELEDFTTVAFADCITEAEEKALNTIIKNDIMFDFDFEEFYMSYAELAGQIRSEEVSQRGEALTHMLGDVLASIEDLKVVA